MLLRTFGDKGNDINENFTFEADVVPTFDVVLACSLIGGRKMTK